MSVVSFTHLNKAQKDLWLPKLFAILHENMHAIVPSGLDYSQEEALWLANVSPALDKAPRQILLCHVGRDLAGYIQYYIRDRMLMVEEFQLKKSYRRTGLFGRICRHLIRTLPGDIQTVEAYAHLRNRDSRRIMEKLGMEYLEEPPDSPFVHLRGQAFRIRSFFIQEETHMLTVQPHIHRLTTPYKDIFTTVYAIRSPGGDILFDAASYPEDIDTHILPFLERLGITADTLKYVFISHNHKDHSGGLARLLEHFPNTVIVSRSPTLRETWAGHPFLAPEDGELLLNTFRVVTVPGHTADSAALLDPRTNTLITGDCLQLHGIQGSGDWACNISFPTEHLEAIEKVRAMAVENLLTAHNYQPYGYQAIGQAAVGRTLDACVAPLRRMKALILENPALTDAEIRELFNDEEHRLTVNLRVVASLRAALDAGKLTDL